MRLIDCKPRWITLQNWAVQEPFYIGVSFLCPHCPESAPEFGENRRRRLAVSFWPPIDPANWLSRMNPPPAIGHKRTGDTFDTLTLEPSVGFDGIGHWHGHIINGEMIG